MKQTRNTLVLILWAMLLAVPGALATNGMNLEGYGPIALGMGGASLATDNGTAAVMNNPATLGFVPQGTARLDVALGFLGPDVEASAPGAPKAKSASDAFYMPAFGYARTSGAYTYGLGVFAQGGMGTEYGADSFLAAGTGEEVRSEVSVGRLLAPFVYAVSPTLYVGGSLDFVWAGIDLKAAFNKMQIDALQQSGNVQASGGIGSQMQMLAGAPGYVARFDFSDDSPYTGEAFGTGYGAKLGLLYLPREDLRVGVTYHSKTWLDDLENGASMRVYNDNDGNGFADSPTASGTFTGDIAIRDFQWPALLGVGAAWTPNERWLLAADVKQVYWADVLDKFTMTFTPKETTGELTVSLPQDWEDQLVLALGAAYAATAELTVRAGYNTASNPVPDKYMNLLFPAIVEKHLTAGLGYRTGPLSEVNFAVSQAFEQSQTNSGDRTSVTHSQLNWQLMYSMGF